MANSKFTRTQHSGSHTASEEFANKSPAAQIKCEVATEQILSAKTQGHGRLGPAQPGQPVPAKSAPGLAPACHLPGLPPMSKSLPSAFSSGSTSAPAPPAALARPGQLRLLECIERDHMVLYECRAEQELPFDLACHCTALSIEAPDMSANCICKG
jgi:hypothetical protein